MFPLLLQVDAEGLGATVCKMAPGRIARHQVMNDIIWRSLGSASIPATKEPSGLVRQDGKRPDGLTLMPWQFACDRQTDEWTNTQTDCAVGQLEINTRENGQKPC